MGLDTGTEIYKIEKVSENYKEIIFSSEIEDIIYNFVTGFIIPYYHYLL